MPDRGYEQYLEMRPPSGNRGYEVYVDSPIPHDPEELSSAVGYYKEGTPLEEIRRLEAQRMQSSLPEQSSVQRFARWTMRTLGKAAPYIAASEIGGPIGAKLLPRLPVLGNVLGSALSQAGVAGTQGATFGEAAATVPLVLATEGLMTKFGRGSALKRGVPPDVARATLSRGTIGRAGEMIGRVTNAQEAAEATRISNATKSALLRKSPGRQRAEDLLREAETNYAEAPMMSEPHIETKEVVSQIVDESGRPFTRQVTTEIPSEVLKPVSSEPLKGRMAGLMERNPTTPEQHALNAMIQHRIDTLPERMSYADLDSFIRSMSEPIKGNYGGIDIKMPVQLRMRILGGARTYRNRLVTGIGPPMREAGQYLESTKTLSKMLIYKSGKVRPGAVNVWRQAMGNDIIKQRLENFERATGGQYDVINRGMALARKSYWAKEDAQAASGILRMTSRGNMAVSIKTPGWVAKGLLLGSKPAGAITSSMMQQAYKEQREQTPEEMFPGMTNIGGSQ